MTQSRWGGVPGVAATTLAAVCLAGCAAQGEKASTSTHSTASTPSGTQHHLGHVSYVIPDGYSVVEMPTTDKSVAGYIHGDGDFVMVQVTSGSIQKLYGLTASSPDLCTTVGKAIEQQFHDDSGPYEAPPALTITKAQPVQFAAQSGCEVDGEMQAADAEKLMSGSQALPGISFKAGQPVRVSSVLVNGGHGVLVRVVGIHSPAASDVGVEKAVAGSTADTLATAEPTS